MSFNAASLFRKFDALKLQIARYKKTTQIHNPRDICGRMLAHWDPTHPTT